MDCFVASAPRNDGCLAAGVDFRFIWFPIQLPGIRDMHPHCRGAVRPGFAWDRGPPKQRGRRESRVRAAPAVSCAKETRKTHTSIQVQRRQSGFPCAMGYGLFRALPGDRAFLPPSPARSFASRELDASVGAPGPHGFTVRAACARLSQGFASTASHRAFVTIASRPSHWVRRRGVMPVICATCEAEYFCARGWTGFWVICPTRLSK